MATLPLSHSEASNASGVTGPPPSASYLDPPSPPPLRPPSGPARSRGSEQRSPPVTAFLFCWYPPTHDSVLQVTPEDFHTCNLSSPVLKLDDGNSIFNPTKPDRVYFISGEPKHCLKGQKLWGDVPKADGTLVQPSSEDLAALAPTPGALPAGTVSAALPDGARSADDMSASDEEHSSANALQAIAGVGSVVAVAAFSVVLPLLLM